jgi:hypothetical protein
MENAVQFKPVGSSLGTDDRRMSVVASIVVDIAAERHQIYESNPGPITCYDRNSLAKLRIITLSVCE